MKRIAFAVVIAFSLMLEHSPAISQHLRTPRDSVGFCWESGQMTRFISFLDSIEGENAPGTENIVAAISPHDDYLYAGRVYFPLFKRLRAKEAVIFGVTHRTVRMEIGDPRGVAVFDSHDAWFAPYGVIGISPLREYLIAGLDTSMYRIDDRAHALEHSIEALLPFLQYSNRGIKITPIMITAMPFERMDAISDTLASLIRQYMDSHALRLGDDIVFLMSSDANHYGLDFGNVPFGDDRAAHAAAVNNDLRIARTCLDGTVSASKIRNLTTELEHVVWCGRYSVPFGLLVTDKVLHRLGKKARGRMLWYSDTWTEGVLPWKGSDMGTTAPFSLKHWVGFLSEEFHL